MAGRRYRGGGRGSSAPALSDRTQPAAAGPELRHGRNRVDRIVAAAEAAGLAPGGPPLSRPEWERRVPELFAERVVPAVAAPTQELVRFHATIVERLAASTVTTVWQRLCDEQGLTVSLSTFRRYVPPASYPITSTGPPPSVDPARRS